MTSPITGADAVALVWALTDLFLRGQTLSHLDF
jgi:hypothetical protein